MNPSSIRSGKVLTENFKAAAGLHRVDSNSLCKNSISNFFTSPKSEVSATDDLKKKSNINVGFQRLFGGNKSSEGPKLRKGDNSQQKKKDIAPKSGPLDSYFGKKATRKPENAEETDAPTKKQGSKRKSSKQEKEVVILVDDNNDSNVSGAESIIIEDTDEDDEDFQVKKKKKKTESKKKKPVLTEQPTEDSDVETLSTKKKRNNPGLTLESRTLYLIDEADIIFAESDVGFSSALCRLIESGEKPFILTANSLERIENNLLQHCICVEMHRPLQNEFCRFVASVLVKQRIFNIGCKEIEKLAAITKCDIRKALKLIHFYGDSLSSQLCGSKSVETIPKVGIVQKLLWSSQFDVLETCVEERWQPPGGLLKDTLDDIPFLGYTNMIEKHDYLEQSAGEILKYLKESVCSCFRHVQFLLFISVLISTFDHRCWKICYCKQSLDPLGDYFH